MVSKDGDAERVGTERDLVISARDATILARCLERRALPLVLAEGRGLSPMDHGRAEWREELQTLRALLRRLGSTVRAGGENRWRSEPAASAQPN